MNSEAYEKLLVLFKTIRVDISWFARDYNQIAVHLTLAPIRAEWEIVVFERSLKDRTLELIPLLTDSEWEEIQEHMIRIADNTPDLGLMTKRMDWTRALDTVREFGRV